MVAAGPTLWSTALRACLVGFGAIGLDPDAVRAAAGIDAALLADPDARIPFAITARIWPVAQARWGRPGLGLHTGVALPFGELGVIDYVVATAPSLAVGLADLSRVFRVVSHGATYVAFARQRSGAGVLRFSGPFPPDVRDYGVASFVARLRHLGARPSEVTFAGPPFDDARAYARLLGVAPRFGADANAITVRADDLDRPRSDDRYRGLAVIVGREAERLLGALPPADASAQARQVIARLLPAGSPAAAPIARGMSLSVRTLQRRLAEEGTSVRALIEATREQLAVAHLDAGRLRVAEIAYLLGYAEPGTFTSAFKRWRGQSPSAYRRARASEA